MTTPASFEELIRRLRGEEGPAREELLRGFEPAIRRVARRLLQRRLRPLLSTADVVQSVLRSFLADVAAGKFAEDDPNRPGEGAERLEKLLKQMARNKVADYARRQQADKRGGKMANAGPVVDELAECGRPSPEQEALRKEEAEQARLLARQVLEALSPEENLLWLLKEQGRGWAAIAAEVGGTAEGCRKKLERGLGRAARRLGLKDGDHDRAP
jgi:RNA polymerase sigma factor (sigma-70 family)